MQQQTRIINEKTKFKKNSKKHSKKYTSSKTLLQGGKFLGRGSFGCVVAPYIPCSKTYKLSNTKKHLLTDSHEDSNKISKIIIEPDKDVFDEIKISNELRKIDKQQKHFITFDESCRLTKIPSNRKNTVSGYYSGRNTNKSINTFNPIEHKQIDRKFCPIDLRLKPINLIMEHGGYSLFDMLTRNTKESHSIMSLVFTNFKSCFRNLLTGLYKMHQIRIVNRDIKTENIMVNYNPHNPRNPRNHMNSFIDMRFIDFGLSTNITDSLASKIETKHKQTHNTYTTYNNITLEGTEDLLAPEVIISALINEYYNINKQTLLYKVQYYIKGRVKKMLISLNETTIAYKLENTIAILFNKIYNEFVSNTITNKFFGTTIDRLNGYLQKGDIYSLGITIYEFLELYNKEHNNQYDDVRNGKFRNSNIKNIIVKKDLKLHNLLIHMIEPNPDLRYNVLECLRDPYFQ